VIRGIGGLIHVIGVFLHQYLPTAAIVGVFLSRAVHGLSQMTFIVGMAYIGANFPKEEKAAAIGAVSTMMMLGLVVGPMSGEAMAALLENVPKMSMFGTYASPGWFSILLSVIPYVYISTKFIDDKLLPKPPQGAAASEKIDLLSVYLIAYNGFVGYAGWLSLEGTLSLLTNELYGWTALQSFFIWLAFSLSMVSAARLFIELNRRGWSTLQICTLKNIFMLLGGAVLINWSDLMGGVGPWTLGFGVLCAGLGEIMNFNLHNTLLAMKVPPSQQAKYQALVQASGQLGRALGPLFATAVLSYGTHHNEPGKHFGANLTFITQFTLAVLANFPPLFWWRHMYGPWNKEQ